MNPDNSNSEEKDIKKDFSWILKTSKDLDDRGLSLKTTYPHQQQTAKHDRLQQMGHDTEDRHSQAQ